MAATPDEPRVLTVRPEGERAAALPAGPLEPHHRTLESGLCAWVEERTGQRLGYVEQLYTFGDANRHASARGGPERVLSVGYLALVREARPDRASDAQWLGWYRFFPWEDWRGGEPAVMGRIADGPVQEPQALPRRRIRTGADATPAAVAPQPSRRRPGSPIEVRLHARQPHIGSDAP